MPRSSNIIQKNSRVQAEEIAEQVGLSALLYSVG